MNEPLLPDIVRDYWAMLHKRRALLVASVACALLVAVLHDLVTPPVYEATARILVDTAAPAVLSAAEVVASADPESEGLETQVELLRSRTVVERVLEGLGPEGAAKLAAEPAVSPFDAFRARLRVGTERGTRLINVHFQARDPALAAAATNLLVRVYVEHWGERRYAPPREATDWLSGRTGEAKRRLRESEEALQRLRERDRSAETAESLARLTQAYLEARTDRIAKAAIHAEMVSRPRADLEALAVVRESPFLQGLLNERASLRERETELRETLGERHPEWVALHSQAEALEEQIRAGIQSLVAAVEADYRTAEARETRLDQEIRRARRSALYAGRRSLELAGLAREVESRRRVLEEISRRGQETGLESRLRSSGVRVVEDAEAPRTPVLPRRGRNYRLALVLGLGFGVFLCVLLERAAMSVRTPEDVTRGLGLPFLGFVPKAILAPEAGPVVFRDPQSPPAEAWRVVRTNVLSCLANGRGRVVLVTSARPAEGKTTTAANLAAALALNGARVLALDADLRRPALHSHFGLARAPGLTEALGSRRRLRRAIRPTRVKGLQVLPAGGAPDNPAELLGSPALQQVVAAERDRYDWIVLDTPPVLALADAAVLSTLADGIVLVAEAEETGRAELQRASEQVSRVGGKLAGVILNKVDLVRNAGYYAQYYSEYYYKYYSASA